MSGARESCASAARLRARPLLTALGLALGLGVTGLLAMALALPWALPGAGQAKGESRSASGSESEGLLARGAYLARVGNCAGCHSAPGQPPFSGGAALPTPFGPAYAGNLTPDAATGLGAWNADDFWRALHQGRGRDGRRLVPAFPYTSYTRVTRADSDALFAWLRSLPAVQRANRPQGLRFPYNTQAALALWQWLYFEPHEPAQEGNGGTPEGTTEVRRGEYLVRGLGHCDACHAPRDAWGGPAAQLSGGDIPGQPWFAPSLQPRDGGPDAGELVALLRGGRHAGGSASGPMAAVVHQSTQHWTLPDLQAAAAYLLALPPQAVRTPAAPPAAAQPDPASRELGRRLYAEQCADCHGAAGEGAPGAYPALAGNATVLQPGARNFVQVLRRGSFGPSTTQHPRPYGMPPQALDEAQSLAIVNHVRQSFGNRASAIDALEMLKAR